MVQYISFSEFINEHLISYFFIPALAIIVYLICALLDYVRVKLFTALKITKYLDMLSFSIDEKIRL